MRSGVRDPYTILGVSRQAEATEIKAAFRRLAREHHPDRNPGDPSAEARFREINDAYQLLSDPAQRARYDRFGTEPPPPGPGSQPGFGGLEDLLGEILGAFGRRPSTRGDMREALVLSFREAALGCQKALTYERIDLCGECQGDGAHPGSGHHVCRQCGGAGRVAAATPGWFAARTEQVCSACGGRGKQPVRPCSHCAGRGLSTRKRTIEVTVPAGIEAGASQLVTGGGSRLAPGMAAGDLELVVQIEDDPNFLREGDDVVSELSLSFARAALGGPVQIETLHGMRTLQIPAGSKPGDELQLKGEGVPHRFRTGAGHHRVRLRVVVPRSLSSRARQLLLDFDAATHDADAGLLSKLKALLQS